MPTLATTLQDLRTSYGFTVDEVAALSELSSGRVVAVEQGSTPTLGELVALGRALAVDPADLNAGSAAESRKTVARFRAPVGVRTISPFDARLLAVAAECGRIGAELTRLLKKSPGPIAAARQVKGVDSTPAPWRQGYALGRQARLQLASAQEPLVSMQRWMVDAGVHVAFVAFESSEIEAASVFEPRAMPVVLLNARHDRVKHKLTRRAILGHELCHLLHDGGRRDLTIVSRQQDESPLEQRANGFAPNFLAPRGWVKSGDVAPKKLVSTVAKQWGLTFEGAAWHVKNLGFISADVATELVERSREHVAAGRFEPELTFASPEQVGLDVAPSALASGLLSDLAIQACAEGEISRGRAREILSIR